MSAGDYSSFLSDFGNVASVSSLLLQLVEFVRSSAVDRRQLNPQDVMDWIKRADASLAHKIERIDGHLESINWLLLQLIARGADSVLGELSRHQSATLGEIRDLLVKGSAFPDLPPIMVRVVSGPQALTHKGIGQTFQVSLNFVNKSHIHVTIRRAEVCFDVDGKPIEAMSNGGFSLKPMGDSMVLQFGSKPIQESPRGARLCSLQLWVDQDAESSPRVYVPSDRAGNLQLLGTAAHKGPRWRFKDRRSEQSMFTATLLYRSPSFSDYWRVIDDGGAERDVQSSAAFTPISDAEGNDRD